MFSSVAHAQDRSNAAIDPRGAASVTELFRTPRADEDGDLTRGMLFALPLSLALWVPILWVAAHLL